MLKLFRCFHSERVRSKNKRDPLYNFISYLELNLTKNYFEAYFKELSRQFKPYFNITQYSKFLYKMLSNIRQINSGRFLIYEQKITCLSQISRSVFENLPHLPHSMVNKQKGISKEMQQKGLNFYQYYDPFLSFIGQKQLANFNRNANLLASYSDLGACMLPNDTYFFTEFLYPFLNKHIFIVFMVIIIMFPHNN